MNSTNRVLNRLFLLLVGLLLLAGGLAAVAVVVLPEWSGLWRQSAPTWQQALDDAQQVGPAAVGVPHPVPWFLPAALVVSLAVVVMLLIFVFTQGRGRLGRVADGWHVAESEADTFLSVDVQVAREAIRQASRGIRGMAEPSVTAYRVKRESALKLTVSVSDGMDPSALIRPLEVALQEWDELLGKDIPIYVQLTPAIGEGVRTPLRALTTGRRQPSHVE